MTFELVMRNVSSFNCDRYFHDLFTEPKTSYCICIVLGGTRYYRGNSRVVHGTIGYRSRPTTSSARVLPHEFTTTNVATQYAPFKRLHSKLIIFVLLPRATLCVSANFTVGRCPSVWPSRSCIISRRLNISSDFFLGPVAQSF